MALYLKNPDDGYKYTKGSNIKLNWKCPYCGYEFSKSVNKMYSSSSYCLKCNPVNSFGERYISNMLDQLCVLYENEKQFDWSNSRRYDYYLPEHNCIIEIHGKQHYKQTFKAGRTPIEEYLNDKYKEELARKNGINKYVVIKNINSNADILKHNILESGLCDILFFSANEVDWEECKSASYNSKIYDICDYYENVSKKIEDIIQYSGMCKNSVREYLKNGAEIGICSYDPIIAIENARKENGEKIIKNMSKPVIQRKLNGEYVREFPSIQEAQRTVHTSKICEVLKGRRNSAGGYYWEYKK